MNSAQAQELKECLLEIKNTSVTMELQINVMNKKEFDKNIIVIINKVKRAIEILGEK